MLVSLHRVRTAKSPNSASSPPSDPGQTTRGAGPPPQRGEAFKMLRILILLLVLLVVALYDLAGTLSQYALATSPLYVAIYPIAADDSPVTERISRHSTPSASSPSIGSSHGRRSAIICDRRAGQNPAQSRIARSLRRGARRTPACWRPLCGACGCGTGPGGSAGM